MIKTFKTYGYNNLLEQSEQHLIYKQDFHRLMMFGREVFQPLDVTLGTLKIDPPKKEVSQYINELVDNLALGKNHDTARENLKAKQHRQKGLYNLKNYHTVLYTIGDQATKVEQSTKLQSPCKGPYLITAVKPPVLYRKKDRKCESWTD